MVIAPHITTTPDFPTVRFREPKEQIDLETELNKILKIQGWGVGTYFNVQFVNHERTKLLASVTYVVTEEHEELRVNESIPGHPVTTNVVTRRCEEAGPWKWFVVEAPVEEPAKTKMPYVRWNPGKKVHEVRLNGEVLFETKDKEEAREVANGGR